MSLGKTLQSLIKSVLPSIRSNIHTLSLFPRVLLDVNPLLLIKFILDILLQLAKRVNDLHGTKYTTSFITTVNSLRNKLHQFLTKAYVLHNEEDTLIFCYGIKPWLSERSIWVIPEYNRWSKSAPWCVNGIKKVVFDPSFKDFQPHSTREWFSGLNMLTTIEGLENFDTSQVTSMNRMFSGCSSLTTLDLSHFDTSKVGDMCLMFSGCSSLTTLDLSNFYTSEVTNMKNMFYGCSALRMLKAYLQISQGTNISNMYSGTIYEKK